MKGEDIRRILYVGEWLNDEIVKAAVSLIDKRNKASDFRSVLLI